MKTNGNTWTPLETNENEWNRLETNRNLCKGIHYETILMKTKQNKVAQMEAHGNK